MKALTALTFTGALALSAIAVATTTQSTQAKEKKTMELGNFSVSLAVKDIKASKAFYEKLDFKEVGGELEQNWIILQNGTTTIGLFQGMFENNLMTFNPGWTKDQETLKDFQDVRELQSASGLRPNARPTGILNRCLARVGGRRISGRISGIDLAQSHRRSSQVTPGVDDARFS